MIRISLLIFILNLSYSSTAQDTLQSSLDTDFAEVSIHDTIPNFLLIKDSETSDEWERDTIKLKDVTIFSSKHADYEPAYAAIQHKDKLIVWWFGTSYLLRGISIDTITLYKKTYLKIRWEEGDGRWWFDDRSGGITIIDINEPTCLLHLVTYRSRFETNSEDRYSNDEPYIYCRYNQQVSFNGNLLVIEPAEIEHLENDDDSNDCPTPYIAGKYVWNGFNWIKTD